MEKNVFSGSSPYEAPETEFVFVKMESCILSTDINSVPVEDWEEIGG